MLPASRYLCWPLAICVLCLCSCSNLRAQASVPRPKTTAAKPPRPFLAPLQWHGLRLLQATLAQASTLRPNMAAFLLLQVARGYARGNVSNSDAILKQAFAASLSMENIAPQFSEGEEPFCPTMQGCGIKIWLQQAILSALNSEADIQTLLPGAQPQVQRQVTESLIFRYLAKKNFAEAEALINSLAGLNQYPYAAAMQLMLALPPPANAERVAIFARALNAYQQQDQEDTYGGAFDGFAGMVLRFGHQVPPAMVVAAIDQILERAKDDSAGPNQSRFTFSGDAGTVALSSEYEFRLFQLLPALQELDQPQAEGLLRDNPEVKALLDRFPQGLQTVQPDYQLHPLKPGLPPPIFSSTVSSTDAPPVAINALAIQAQQEIRAKEEAVAAKADTDPRQAVADAMSLPLIAPGAGAYGEEFSPRARTLLAIARKSGNKNRDVTRNALDELRRSLSQSPLLAQAHFLDDAAEEFLAIEDKDDAGKTLKQALDVADQLYAKDSDTEDPNQAFKGAWPSANQWRRCVCIAARLAPSAAEAIIAGIRDPEIAAFEKVYFAESLMGVPQAQMDLADIHKKSAWFGIF